MPTGRTLLASLALIAPLLFVGCGPGSGTERPYGLAVVEGEAYVARGDSTVHIVTVVRRAFDQPVRIDVRDLPRGVTAASAEVPGSATEASLRLIAADDATLGVHRLRLLGTAAGADPVEQPLTLTVGGARLTLDETFGDRGTVFLEFLDREIGAFGDYEVCDLIPESDGKIMIAGTIRYYQPDVQRWVWFFLRLLADGTRDPSFGSTGFKSILMATTDGAPEHGTWRAIMRSAIRTRGGGYVAVGGRELPDGRWQHAMVYRTDRGRVARSYGTEADLLPMPMTRRGWDANDVIELQDGRFLVVGAIPSGQAGSLISLQRFDARLHPDASIVPVGLRTHRFLGADAGALRIAPLSSTQLMVAGWYARPSPGGGTDPGIALLRVRADGSADPGAGDLEEVAYYDGSWQFLSDMITEYGKPVLAGYSGGETRYPFLDRVRGDASDPGFTLTELDGVIDSVFTGLVRTWHGKYTVGWMGDPGVSAAFACRFGRDGGLDPSRGIGGRIHIPFQIGASPERAQAIGVQADGKLVIAGTSAGRLAIMRRWP